MRILLAALCLSLILGLSAEACIGPGTCPDGDATGEPFTRRTSGIGHVVDVYELTNGQFFYEIIWREAENTADWQRSTFILPLEHIFPCTKEPEPVCSNQVNVVRLRDGPRIYHAKPDGSPSEFTGTFALMPPLHN